MSPSGICFGCRRPTGKASHAKWCAECWPAAKRANARIARRRRLGLETAPHLCDDCRQPTNRHWCARFCHACVKARLAARRRTPRYKAHQAKHRMSPKRKITVAAWNERNKERRAIQQHAAYLRRVAARPVRVTACATLSCRGQFIRPKGSHRMFCEDCQAAFYGRSYLVALARKAASRGEWNRAA